MFGCCCRDGDDLRPGPPGDLGARPRAGETKAEVRRDRNTITIHVPLAFRRRGGRTLIVSAAGEQQWAPPPPRVDRPLVMALARAFRWKEMLESGRLATVNELAKVENMNASYVAHVLRFTLLAPDIVEAILDGRQASTMQLQPLMRKGFPVEWEEQHRFCEGDRERSG